MNIITVQMLIGILKQAGESFPDPRTGNNCQYTITDIILAAFSIFFMQSPSFLQGQQKLLESVGKSNAGSLYGIKRIPSENQVRSVLDEGDPESLGVVFYTCLKLLQETGVLPLFEVDLGVDEQGESISSYLVALDGTGTFSSKKISCENCCTKTSKKGIVTYQHHTLLPALVNPGRAEVIPFFSEFIVPQDGHQKQDCENAAAKRWLKKHGSQLQALLSKKATMLGDDLYSRQPVIEEINKQGFNYILVSKENSHPWMYDHINALETNPYTEGGKKKQYLKPEDILHSFTTSEQDGKHQIKTSYRYALRVPLKDDPQALLVNWVEITQVKEWKDRKTGEKKQEQIYKNAFITDHHITRGNVATIVKAGRCRWKVENEGINTLKTKGYHFEHNYGHGKKNLSNVLLTLILIAFLFHTMLDLGDDLYRKLKKRIRVRKTFFQHLSTLTTFFVWDDWDQLFDFMWKRLNDIPVRAPT